MDSGSKGIASERAAALVVYQLADSLVQFRYYIELNYLGADEPYAFRGEHPPPPPIIQECFSQVLAAATRLAHTLLVPEATALISATRSIHQQFRETWLDKVHRKLLAERRDVSETNEFGNTRELNWWDLKNSPHGPSAWSELQAIADRLAEELPNSYRLVFNLSRLLAEVCFPCPSSYSTAMEDIPVFDDDHLITDIGPRIADLVHEIRTRFHLLQTVEEWLDGANSDGAAKKLREDVLSDLATASRPPTTANPSAPPESPPQAGAATCVASTTVPAPVPSPGSPQHQVQNDGVRSATATSPQISDDAATGNLLTSSIEALSAPAMPPVAATLFVAPLNPDEDVHALSALKKKMDPDDAYIGQSLPVLRLFGQIQTLNRMPDDPIVILGPPGSGKTCLARRIHETSERSKGPFLDLSADDVIGGDETIRRVKWAGHGPNSGLSGIRDNATAPGLLELTRGGTIFLDELHNLDKVSLNFLRKVLDRDRQIPLALGTGEGRTPDVRLIFATFHNLEQLQRDGQLPPDFVRRLRGRYLTVPHLKARKEDIPLFVEELRGECKPGEDFMLSLLLHDWEAGQVDELITTIRSVVANAGGKGDLAAAHLRGLLPDGVIARVAHMPPAEVRRTLFSFLVLALEAQGFERGSGLQKRLALLLSVSPSTITRRLGEAGLNEPQCIESDSADTP